ncbi:hypothetical protein RN001_006970 [Aquatica leii]|uniref:Phosphatidylserine decarboxylase proenzyme, mitochondrial n=1 Tax=Aquatica leii TaxID=1421715 RepID=A0AAN7SBS4_9COLE|nr:hypothetical protein RN001_006970 [Aquatica leii]
MLIGKISKQFINANCSTLLQQKWNLSSINHIKLITTNRGKIREWSTWKGIMTGFVPLGICLVAVMQWRAYRKLSTERYAKQWEISCYCALPLRTVSRCWGWLADKQIPEWIRPYMYGLYSFTFGVNLNEAANEDYKAYRSLAEFFCRPLKEGARLVDNDSCLVAPCDGTVLHFGTVNSGHIEQVKGVTYTLENFLGDNIWYKNPNVEAKNYQNGLLYNKLDNSRLYHCVIYLAPGDYHRFHSPTDWQPTLRRHFSGQLLSVNPGVAKWLPGLFCINERAIYLGRWAYGFFSLAAIGATNVGSIKIYCDKWLQTNLPKYKQRGQISKDKYLGSNLKFMKGDAFGEFRMGSTIVLIFEAPKNFQFNLVPGQRVKMGQAISCMTEEKYLDWLHNPQHIKTTNLS